MTCPSCRLVPLAILLALPSLAVAANASDALTPKLAYTGEARHARWWQAQRHRLRRPADVRRRC